MNAKTKIRLGLGVILALALGCLGHGWHAIRAANGAFAEVSRQRRSVEEAMRAARARIASHRRDIALLEAASSATPPSSNPAAPTAGRTGPRLAFLLEANPGLMDLYLKAFRANLADRCGWIYEKLGLNPAQVDRIEDVTAEHEQEIMDLRVAASAQNLPMSDPGISALRRQADQEYEAAVIAAIGEAAGRQFLQYPALPGTMQSVLDNLADVAALSPAPVTYARAAELAPLLAGSAAPPSHANEPASVAWTRLMDQLGGSLSAPQRESLQAAASLNEVNGLVREFYTRQAPAPGAN